MLGDVCDNMSLILSLIIGVILLAIGLAIVEPLMIMAGVVILIGLTAIWYNE